MGYGDLPGADQFSQSFQPDAAVPAHGVMVATGDKTVNGEHVLTTVQYDGTQPLGALWVNRPVACAASAYGKCRLALPGPLRIASTGTIAAGDHCGPVPNTWAVSADYGGYVALGAAASDVVTVQRQVVAWVLFVLTADIESTDTAATLLDLTAATTGVSITVTDPTGEYLGGEAGSKGSAKMIGDKFYINSLACPDSPATIDAAIGMAGGD